MPRRRKLRQEEEIYVRKPFDIPYFAHQPLDPGRFPGSIGYSVGSPPKSNMASNTGDDNQDWEDPDNESIMSGEDGNPNSATSRSKQKHLDSELDHGNKSHKKMKVDGGRPAVAKKITADLDSDDDLIVRMKDARYLEKDIAQRLVDEGRIRYNPKTIGTRYLRIQKALQKQQDDLLDAELSDWHDGDDDVLDQAIKKADQELNKQIQWLQAKKWRMVANDLKERKPVTNFSPNACEKRFNALQTGTAKAVPESVLDPDDEVQASIQRRKEREAKITEDVSKWTVKQENMEKNGWNSRTAQRLQK